MTLIVRPIQPAEHASAADLTVEVYVGGGFSGADYEPQLRDVSSRAATATVLVALEDDVLVGAVTVATRGGPWAEQSVPGEAVIRMLAVSPDARGSGAGTALVAACLTQAADDGCVLVRLSSQENMTTAHRLYERFGFVRTPALDWSPVPWLKLRAYGLPLTPWCRQCGLELTAGGHAACRRAAELDPPRYCPQCRRRMVVQVLPTGWTARCSEHGVRTT